jgi:hypothetical protein
MQLYIVKKFRPVLSERRVRAHAPYFFVSNCADSSVFLKHCFYCFQTAITAIID